MTMKKILLLLTGLLFTLLSVNAQTTQDFTTVGAGTFTVPCGVSSITVHVWGGGGGSGADGNNDALTGGGGGSGGYCTQTIAVTPFATINYTVGAGGTASNAGGATTFGTVTANGGQPGGARGATNGAGGAGGTGCTTNGNPGTAGGSVTSGTAGSGGSAPSGGGVTGGAGGVGPAGDADAVAGNAPAGGASGVANTGGGGNAGAAGGRGQIRLVYTVNTSLCKADAVSESRTLTCGTTLGWTDSGNVSGDYGNNQDYTVTFCPTSPADNVIKVVFSTFDTQSGSGVCNDLLEVWQNSTATGAANDQFCGPVGAFTVIADNTTGCLTFRFRSDASTTRPGWAANITCARRCKPLTAAMTGANPTRICPTTALAPNVLNPGSLTVSFDAGTSTASSGFSIARYEWDWGYSNVKTTTTTATTTHTFPTTGIYNVKLQVFDNNTDILSGGCASTNSSQRDIVVMPAPIFTGSTASPISHSACPTTCSNLSLTGVATTQIATTPIPQPVTGVTDLPDGSGVNYETSLNFSGVFPVGSTVTSSCYPTLCLDLEHSWSKDLQMWLIAPNGQQVLFYDRDACITGCGMFCCGTAGFGACVNETSTTPVQSGCPARYCVVNSGGTYSFATNNGFIPRPTTNGTCAEYTGTCENLSNYYAPGTYTSQNSFASLNGAPLNGIWTLRIRDNLASDNGQIFGWSLTFPTACYRELNYFEPDLLDLTWSALGGAPTGTAGTTTSTVVLNPGPFCPGSVASPTYDCVGERLTRPYENICFTSANVGSSYTYRVVARDENSCRYFNDIVVNVVCTLPLEVLNFNARKVERGNILEWSTGSESDIDYFNIERSLDGNEFVSIGSVKANGNRGRNYSYVDPFKNTTVVYYRLKQNDKTGEVWYSEVRAVSPNKVDKAPIIVPNPNAGKFTINFDAEIEETVVVNIVDARGKLVKTEQVKTTLGKNLLDLDMSKISKGSYLIQIINNNNIHNVKMFIE